MHVVSTVACVFYSLFTVFEAFLTALSRLLIFNSFLRCGASWDTPMFISAADNDYDCGRYLGMYISRL